MSIEKTLGKLWTFGNRNEKLVAPKKTTTTTTNKNEETLASKHFAKIQVF